MEEVKMTQPVHIGEILAKNQPAHLPTSEQRVCVCGKTFTAYLNAPSAYQSQCPACREKVQIEQRMKECTDSLPNAIELVLDKWWDNVNPNSKFCSKTFAEFERKLQPKAFDSVNNLQWKDGKSLVLASPGLYGVGKTHLVWALINQIFDTQDKATVDRDAHISRQRCPVYFTSENELLLRIRKTYNKHNESEDDSETEDKIYAKLSQFALLIIDDVGKVRPRDLTFLQGVYFNIIDERYSNDQPIILTTNLDFNQLEEHIGGACADRLREMCGENFIKMTGKSYRQKDVPPKT
jgi:DNA replication protein DnaC